MNFSRVLRAERHERSKIKRLCVVLTMRMMNPDKKNTTPKNLFNGVKKTTKRNFLKLYMLV